MKPIVFVMWRLVPTMMLAVALISGGVLASNKMPPGTFAALNTSKAYAYIDYIGVRAKRIKAYVVGQFESWFHKREEATHEEPRKVVVTSPEAIDVTITERYVCQIHSRAHINVRALDDGYLDEILVKEGQAVKGPSEGYKGDVLFRIRPVLYKAKLDAKAAEARVAQIEYQNTEKLANDKNRVVSPSEVQLFEAKRDRAKAEADLAQAEFDFTEVRAPFDGIVDRLHEQLGSLIKKEDILTTLSDNSLMWVYFNVPERQYLEYMATQKKDKDDQKIELELANHNTFPQKCENVIVEAQFNNETGNIPFRADFLNPDRLLRHGQTGTILIRRTLKDALVIPQRATFEILDKRYVKVVGEDDVAHQTLITIKHELEDIFVIDKGLEAKDKIVLEGVREVEDGKKVEYEFRKPEEALALKNQKFHAE